jgi:hypothetical protein
LPALRAPDAACHPPSFTPRSSIHWPPCVSSRSHCPGPWPNRRWTCRSSTAERATRRAGRNIEKHTRLRVDSLKSCVGWVKRSGPTRCAPLR